jgi:hypothetical protein
LLVESDEVDACESKRRPRTERAGGRDDEACDAASLWINIALPPAHSIAHRPSQG